MWTNLNTGKGWTAAEEETFADIMRRGRLARIAAIQLYRRCKSDRTKSLKLTQGKYAMSDAEVAGMERSKAARLAGLAKARQGVAQNRAFELLEVHA
jgi:hypothetical protein